MNQMRQEISQKQDLQMRTVLAPELRQSLQYLQVPILELQNLVQHELETNPTLEEQPKDDTTPIEVEPGTSDLGENDGGDADNEDFEILARMDSDWREDFRQNKTVTGNNQDAQDRHEFMINSLTEKESLHEHLLDQLKYLGLSEKKRKSAELLIGNIDSDGYLRTSIEELSDTTTIPEDELEEMLDIIQDFHPIGVGARDLQECLKLQLERLGVEDEHVYSIIEDHIENLGNKRYSTIAEKEGICLDKVKEIADFIHTLEPRPGRVFSEETTSYVQPEATIKKIDGEYKVIMHNEYIPRLHISNLYKKMVKDPNASAESKNYVREKIKNALLLIRSIGQRQETMRKICELILEVQRDFMDNGVSGLQPLTMNDIASRLGIHETTVSRGISNKYIRTPQGIYEMKYFFNPGYSKSDGSQVSSRTVMGMVEDYVKNENPKQPLSDQAIVELLKEEGFDVARRTVAKYRNRLNIPTSRQRKIT